MHGFSKGSYVEIQAGRENARAAWVINTFPDGWHESEAQMEHAEETPKHTQT